MNPKMKVKDSLYRVQICLLAIGLGLGLPVDQFEMASLQIQSLSAQGQRYYFDRC